MQGVVRLIVQENSNKIYHSKVNEIFPKKVIISDNLTIADKLKFIKNNVVYMEKITEIVDTTSRIFSTRPLNQSEVLDFMVLAFINNDKIYGLEEAIEYGNWSTSPPEVYTIYANRFEEVNLNLETLIGEVQAVNKFDRFNCDVLRN